MLGPLKTTGGNQAIYDNVTGAEHDADFHQQSTGGANFDADPATGAMQLDVDPTGASPITPRSPPVEMRGEQQLASLSSTMSMPEVSLTRSLAPGRENLPPGSSAQMTSKSNSIVSAPEVLPEPQLRPKTWLQSGISKSKKFFDGTIRYGLFCSTGEPQNL